MFRKNFYLTYCVYKYIRAFILLDIQQASSLTRANDSATAKFMHPCAVVSIPARPTSRSLTNMAEKHLMWPVSIFAVRIKIIYDRTYIDAL